VAIRSSRGCIDKSLPILDIVAYAVAGLPWEYIDMERSVVWLVGCAGNSKVLEVLLLSRCFFVFLSVASPGS